MTAASDADLLKLYARHASQEAFATLVARYLGLVYASAIRQVRSPDLARDVAQEVFIQLARDAGMLRPDCVLPAWLHTATRRRAIDLIRSETRRKRREEIACTTTLDPVARRTKDMDDDTSQRLDEALARLPATDREALILRFFTDLSLREVGQRLGLSEDAAQKRLERALERLRRRLRFGGVDGGILSMGAWLSAQAAPLAPAGLASSIASTALCANSALATGALASTLLMTTTQKIVVSTSLALAAGLGVFQHHHAQELRHQLDELTRSRTEETRAWSARVAALETDNDRLRAEGIRSKPAELREIKPEKIDPAIAALADWIERLQNLKAHFAGHVALSMPEMRLLRDEDWLDAAKQPLATEHDYEKALAHLRNTVKNRFINLTGDALRAFAKENGDAFPTDLRQLLPYLKKPLEPRMLERWIILPQSDPRVSNILIGKADGRVITQRGDSDDAFGIRVVFNTWGNGVTSFSAER
jgi:RNA polymerase sigma factor (sigma-70 family)